MRDDTRLGERLAQRGISRRAFLQYASYLATAMSLGSGAARALAEGLAAARRQSVIWLSFQECTGCVESLTRAHDSTLENLIFDFISLDYQHTLQAAAGRAAEAARTTAMQENWGQYLVVVDGSIPTADGGVYSTIAGVSNLDMLRETAAGAAAILAVGTCAAFGGIPHARPNPTGAVPVSELVLDKPIVNVSGCPPIPIVITGTLSYFLSFGRLPDLDALGRPLMFYGQSIHDRCYRRPFYERGRFAQSFDDEGARRGWCLYELGCKGPVTYNACATLKWNGGVSFPIQSGHGCIGCSEPRFWDRGSFYQPLSAGTCNSVAEAGVAAIAGAALGAHSAATARRRQRAAAEES
jgi:hydrogenase small subunit